MFGTNLTGKSKAELANACNEVINSHFNKVNSSFSFIDTFWLTFFQSLYMVF